MTLLVLAMASCGNKQTGSQDAADEFTVDSLKFHNENEKGIVDLDVDFPLPTGTLLSDSIRQHITNVLGGNSYQGDLNDSQAMIDFYGKQTMAAFDDNEEGGLQWSENTSFKLAEVTPHYVTYEISTYEFTGGAHGIGAYVLCTFNRESGRTFGYDLMKDTDSDAFGQLMKAGMKEYMRFDSSEEPTDEELAQQLMLSDDATIDHLPLPGNMPGLTKDGVQFNYTPYEIAPYVAGTPTFVISYEKIRPFLTEEGLKWIE